MRAKLMELTPASRTRSRKPWWLNIPFTIAWQSSKVPSIASAWTLSAATVVIMRRCTSEMRPWGKSTNRSMHERPDHFDRHLRIRPSGKFLDGWRLKPRPALRQIEAAVARKPRERHLDEVERRSLAAGGDVAHGRAFPCASPLQNTTVAPALAARVDGSITS